MITPYWFTNLTYWSAQVALLTLAAGFLPYFFKIRQPHVLLIYWRALIAVCLLLPFVQPYQPRAFATATLMPADEFARDFPAFKFDQIPHGVPVSYWYIHKFEIIAQIIGLIILAAIAARFTILALGLLKLRQFRRASSPISSHAESSAVLDEMRVRVNTGGEFRLSSDVDSPVTFGLSAPVILLPERFPTLDAQYQSAIACHELLHVRRRDWAHHLSEEILRAALWFHPAIAWLIARIRLSREQVVDLEVVRLTDARKPYLEALLEFTNSRALATAIPAPPFLVERQLAERVALMLKEVRMSRTRLIASLTAITACLAVVVTLAVWTFPLKAAQQYSLPPIQSTDKAVIQFVPGGIVGGVTGGVTHGVPGGVAVGVTVSGAPNVTITAVPGGVVGGVTSGVSGGISGGETGGVPAPPQQDVKAALGASPISTKRVPPTYPSGASAPQTSGQIPHAGENGVTMPKCEYCPKPEYSAEARDAKIQGTVYLQVEVLTTGRAGEIKVTRSLEKSLDEQAIKSVKEKWTFKPATDPNGNPVNAIVPVEVSFQLFGPPQPTPPPTGRSAAALPASAPLTPNETLETKIFTAPVSDNGKSTPFYMGLVNPQTLYAPNAELPRLARQANVQGSVTLNIILNTEGKVIVAEYVKGPTMLVQSAISTVRDWIIKGTHDGAPVTFQISVEVGFNGDK